MAGIILPNEVFDSSFAYTGAETTFASGFRALSAAHVFAEYTPPSGIVAALTQGVHFSVTLAADGTVTLNKLSSFGATPGTLRGYRKTPATQGTDFANLSRYTADVHTNLHTAAAMRSAERSGDVAIEAAARAAAVAAEAATRLAADNALGGRATALEAYFGPAENGYNVVDANGMALLPPNAGEDTAPQRTGRTLYAQVDRFGFAYGGAGDFPIEEVRARDARAIAYSVLARGSLGAMSTTAQRPVFNYNQIVEYGQSLSLGASGLSVLSTTARNGSVMLGGSANGGGATTFDPVGGVADFEPLRAVAIVAAGLYEDPGVGAVNFLKDLWLNHLAQGADTTRNLLLTSCGTGGKRISELSKGATPAYYNRITSAATQAKAAANALGKTIGCPAILFDQGEQDYDGTVPTATWKAAAIQLKADIAADMATIHGQAKPPIMITYQTSGPWVGTDVLEISQAQYELMKEQKDWYLASPSYHVVSQNDGHLTGNGYRWMGLYQGKALYEVLIRGRAWKPLMPLEVCGLGRTILVTFSIPFPPLQWLPVYVGRTPTMFANKGFDAYDDLGLLNVVSADIVGQASVALYLDRPLGNNAFVRYGAFTTFRGKGNLADSDPIVAPENYIYDAGQMDASENIAALVNKPYPLNNWCVLFKERVSNPN
jgi:hypothetical protein